MKRFFTIIIIIMVINPMQVVLAQDPVKTPTPYKLNMPTPRATPTRKNVTPTPTMGPPTVGCGPIYTETVKIADGVFNPILDNMNETIGQSTGYAKANDILGYVQMIVSLLLFMATLNSAFAAILLGVAFVILVLAIKGFVSLIRYLKQLIPALG